MHQAIPRLYDLVAGLGLVFALFVVFVVDLLTRPSQNLGENTLVVRVLDDHMHSLSTQKRLRLAVTPTVKKWDAMTNSMQIWDDMGKLLHELGDGYKFDEIETNSIRNNPELLDDYDVLFFTCAPGGEDLRNALLAFVSRGGVLYASDWRFDAVAAAFPEMVDPVTRGKGIAQSVQADVVDPNLRDILGPKIELKFDLSGWKTAAFQGPRVTRLLEGNFRKKNDKTSNETKERAPFLVRFPVGKGTVIFTSFHNEKQNSATERKLLEYLVFSLVTAGIDAEVQTTMSENGFAAQRSNLLSTPKEHPSVTKTYTHSQTGALRFAVGFRNEGAKLRFHLKSPQDKHFTWEGTSAVVLEVPDAVSGTWTYTVTAVQLPYENFPFTVTVGAKK